MALLALALPREELVQPLSDWQDKSLARTSHEAVIQQAVQTSWFVRILARQGKAVAGHATMQSRAVQCCIVRADWETGAGNLACTCAPLRAVSVRRSHSVPRSWPYAMHCWSTLRAGVRTLYRHTPCPCLLPRIKYMYSYIYEAYRLLRCIAAIVFPLDHA